MQFKSQSERMEGIDYENLSIYFKDQLNPELFSMVYRAKGKYETVLQDVDFNKYTNADVLRYCQIYKNISQNNGRKK